MSIVVSYRLDTPLLREALAAVPALGLRVEQAGALDAASTLLVVRAAGREFEAFEAALEDDPTVTAATVLDAELGGERVYQLEVPADESTYTGWLSLGGVLLDATATEAGWAVRMRFPDREALSAYRTTCRERGVEFVLRSVRDATDSTEAYPYGLTAPQYEILAAALEDGYFEVPRDTRMGDLATEFDISDQAASERLRRGLSRLLSSLAVDEYYR